MVAKMAETLDRLSRGRLILGLGGGFSDEEFRAFGLGVPTPGEKVDGLEEAVRIIRGLWSEPDFTYRGRRYRTERANVEPKPDRAIPIWLGTYGERALAVTGRLAGGWIPSLGFAPPDVVPVMRQQVLAAARSAGGEPEEITCVYNLEVRIGDRDSRPDVVSPPARWPSGSAPFVHLGFTAFNFIFVGPAEDEQRERLAREVIPAVRGGV